MILAAELGWAFWQVARGEGPGVETAARAPGADISTVRAIGQVLFTDYALAFEITSLLILVAMVGAVVLAKRHV